MNKSISAIILFVLLLTLSISSYAYAQKPEVIQGLSWLESNQKTDGSWGGQNSFRDTATVIDAYRVLGQSGLAYQSGLNWVGTASLESNDYIARRVISLAGAGVDVTAALQQFILNQNPDGGWGYFQGYESDVYDTAIILAAFSAARFHSPNATARAVNYLLSKQNVNGSFGLLPDAGGEVATTSSAVMMLKIFGSHDLVTDPINKSTAWLLNKQNPDGGFGDSPSTLHGTRFALRALLDSGKMQVTSLQNAINYVTSIQLPDGSWDDDPYETAMAVQILGDLKPNPSVSAVDMQISNMTPKSGEVVRISAIIRNTGSEAVSNIPVQILCETLDHQLTKLVGTQTITSLEVGGSATVEASFDTKGLVGPYNIIVKIDMDNAFEELTKEDNEASIQISVIPIPDLVIATENIVFSKNPVSIGENVTVTATVSNQGTYSAKNVEISFYHDALLTENLIGTSVIPLLDAGMSASREVTWKTNKAGASIPIYAVVDPRNIIDEFRKDNNQAVKLFGVNTLAGTNLSVSYTDVSFNPAVAMQDGSVEISAVIKNDGTMPVESVEVVCYKGDPSSGGLLIGSKTIQSMTPGTASTVIFDWSNIADSGEKSIYIKVDPSNSIQESSKDDNIAFKALNVVSLSDLIVTASSIAFMPPSPKDGEPVSIGITVRNAGGQDARNFRITAYEGTTAIGSQSIVLLSGNSQQTVSFTYSTTGKIGMHEITVIADPDNAVHETNRNNNRAVRSFGVNNVNTWLTEEYISPNGDGIKDSTTFSFRLDMPQTVKIVAVNKNDEIVRTFSGGNLENSSGGNITWDGLDDSGRVVDDGRYRLQVRVTAERVLQEASVVVDTNNSTIGDALATGNLLFNDLSCKIPAYQADKSEWLSDGRGFVLHIPQNYYSVGLDMVIENEGLYIVSPNGRDVQKITMDQWLIGSNRNIIAFSPSPDGQKIAISTKRWVQFGSYGADYTFIYEIWVMESDGSNLKLLDSIDENSVRDLAATTLRASMLFESYHIDGSSAYIVSTMKGLKWSSDNETIAYPVSWYYGPMSKIAPFSDYGVDLYAVNIMSGTRTKIYSRTKTNETYLNQGAPGDWLPESYYQWSPNGKFMSVLDYSYNNSGRLAGASLNINDKTGLSNRTISVPLISLINGHPVFFYRWLDNSSIYIDEEAWDYYSWVWHYKSDYYIVDVINSQIKDVPPLSGVLTRDKRAYISEGRLMIQNINDYTEEVLVSLDEAPIEDIVVSPDATKIAFRIQSFYGYKLGVVTVDTKEVAILSNVDPGPDNLGAWHIAWLPDSSFLVVNVQFGESPGSALFLVDTRNGQKTFLSDGWLTDGNGQKLEQIFDMPAYKNYILYMRNDYNAIAEPQEGCIPKSSPNGSPWLWTMSSSANLTAELVPVKGDAEVVLTGTVADLNFEGYKIEYASFESPSTWYSIIPFSDLQIRNGTLAVWVPPGEGTYYVKLTAWDKAGNVAENKQKVAWMMSSTSVTNIYISRDLFSPNGDGVLDTAELHYRVLGPMHVEFSIYDEKNVLRRTFMEDQPVPGEYYISWDGRDEVGRTVADGRYRIRVLDYDFHVEVDNTAPDVALRFGVDKGVDPMGMRVSLKATAMDNNFEHWQADAAKMTPGGIIWEKVTDGAEQLKPKNAGFGAVEFPVVVDRMLVDAVTGRDFRIVAEDKAGNQSIKVLKAIGEGIYIDPQILNPSTLKLYASETIIQEIDYVIVQWRYPPPPEVDDGSGWVDDMILSSGSHNLSAYFNFDWNYSQINLIPLEFRIKVVDHLGSMFFSNMYVIAENGIIELPNNNSSNFIALIDIKPPSLEDPDHYIFKVLHNIKAQNWTFNLNNLDQPLYSVPLPPPGVTDIIVGKEYFELCKNYMIWASATSPDKLNAVLEGGDHHELKVPCLDVLFGYLEADKCDDLSQKLSVKTSVKLAELSDQELKELSIGTSASSVPLINIPSISEFRVDLPVFGKNYSTLFDVSSLPEGHYTLFERLKYRDVKSDGSVDKETVGYTTFNVDKTLPTATITYPARAQKICPSRNSGPDGVILGIPIQGVVADNTAVKSYELFYGLGTGDGAFIPTGFKGENAVDGQIGVWNVPDSSDSAYSIKLKVVDSAGNSSCYTTEFLVDKSTEVTSLTIDQDIFSPKNGTVSINYEIPDEATIDIIVYRTSQDSSGLNVPESVPVRTIASGVQHSGGIGSASWNGIDDAAAIVPDGQYSIAVFIADSCGNTNQRAVLVEVDGTPPDVVVSYPNSSDQLGGIVEVRGSASDTHFKSYKLDAGQGDSPATWAEIASGESPLLENTLGGWNTFGLEGRWTLRLTASDTLENSAATKVTVDFGQRSNIIRNLAATATFLSPNNDGKLDLTTLDYTLADACEVRFDIMDAAGSSRKTFTTSPSSSGTYMFVWAGSDNSGAVLQDGTYSARLTATLSSDPSFTQEEVLRLTIDSTPPSVDIGRPINDSYLHGQVVVSGSIIDENLLEYSMSCTGDTGVVLNDKGTRNKENHVFGTMSGLSDGRYTLNVQAKDRGENTTEANVSFTVDNTPPKVALYGPKAGESFGLDKNIIAITGSVVEKNLESFTLRYGQGDNPQQWTELAGGNTLPPGSQLFTWNVGKESGIPDGLYTVSLYAQDKGGLIGETRVQVIVDNTPPVTAISAPRDGDYVKAAFGIWGTAYAGAFDKYVIEISHGICSTAAKWFSLKTSTMPITDGLLVSVQTLPSDGDYCIRLTATDKLGKHSETKVNIKIDTHPPATPILMGRIENKQDVNLSWTLNGDPDFAGYKLFRDSSVVNTTLIKDATYLTQNLQEGVYTYTVKAVDMAGNESSLSNEVKLKIDITPPDAKIRLPLDGSMVSGSINITGTAYSGDDFKQYRLFIGQGQNPASWSLLRASPASILNSTLVQWDTTGLNGQYSIKLEAEDLSGNINTHQIVVTLDILPPATPVLLTAVLNGSSVTLTWNANTDPDLAGYLLFRNGQLANAPAVPGDFKLYLITGTTYIDKTLPDGKFKYYLIAVDQAGNLSGQSNSLEVDLDIHPPHAVITAPKTQISFQDKILVKAESTDLDIASVQLQYKRSADAVWLNLGNPVSQAPFMSYLDPVDLGMAYGEYQIRAVATDKGGKTDSAPSSIFVRYTDLAAPKPPLNLKAVANGADILLSWTASAESDLDGYNVYMTTSWGNSMRAYHIKETSYRDNGLPNGNYTCVVKAVDIYGNESNASNEAVVKIYAPALTQPYTPAAQNNISLSGDNASAGSSIEIFRALDGGIVSGGTVQADASGYFILPAVDLVLGENSLSATATDGDGNVSMASDAVIVVYNEPPTTPTGFALAVDGYNVGLSWNANSESDLSGYNVYRNGKKANISSPVTTGYVWSSNYDNYNSVSRAFDSDPATYWTYVSSVSPFIPVWWEIDLPSVELISHIEIHWGTFGGKDYEIQVWSGYAWITHTKVSGNNVQDNYFDLATPYRTDKIRIFVTDTTDSSGRRIMISEVGLLKENLITDTSYVDSSLSDAGYSYNVTAVDYYGFESSPTADINTSVGDVIPPSAPLNLTATALNSSITLNWDQNIENDLAGYNIYRNTAQGWVKINASLLTVNTYADQGLRNGAYAYRLTAVDNAGNESSTSNEVMGVVSISLLDPPRNLRVNSPIEGGALVLSWEYTANQGGYNLYRGTLSGGPYTRITVSPITSTVYTDRGLINGVTYYYVVVAVDLLSNESAYSNQGQGKTVDIIAPQTPEILFPTTSGLPIDLSRDITDISGTAEMGTSVELLRNGGFVGRTTALAEYASQNIQVDYWLYQPNLSPNGKSMAYVYYDSIWIRDLTTGTERLAVEQGESPVWSPDGNKIAYRYWDSNWNYRIFIYDMNSGNTFPLTDDPYLYESDPSWSSDGNKVAFIRSTDGSNDIWIKDLPLGLLSQVTQNINASALRFSPDATKLAYFEYQNLSVINFATGETNLIDSQTDSTSLDWSPDSNNLVYISYKDGNADVYTLNIATMNTDRITSTPDNDMNPVWSPDGNNIAFVRAENDGSGYSIRLADVRAAGPGSVVQENIGSVESVFWTKGGDVGYKAQDAFYIMHFGKFIFNDIPLSVGENIFSVTVTDSSGNKSSESKSISVTVPEILKPDLAVMPDSIAAYPSYPVAGEQVTINIDVTNSGQIDVSDVEVELYMADPSGGASLLKSFKIPYIAAGLAETIGFAWDSTGKVGKHTIIAVADSLNMIDEGDETNNLSTKDVFVVTTEGILMTTSTDFDTYQANQDVKIHVNLMNSGIEKDVVVETSLEDSNGNTIVSLTPISSHMLYDSQQDFDLLWNTGVILAGSYRVHTTLKVGINQPTENIVSLTILPDIKIATTAITEKTIYGPNEDVVVGITIKNTGRNYIIPGVNVRVRLFDAGNNELFAENRDITNLWPGISVPIRSKWNTGLNSSGDYHAIVETYVSDKLLSTNTVMIRLNGFAVISGEISVSPSVVMLGDTINADIKVSNKGNISANGLTIRLLLVDPETQNVVTISEELLNLEMNGIFTRRISFSTAGYALKTYVLVLQFSDQTTTSNLANTSFTVKGANPPTVIIGSPSSGSYLSFMVDFSVQAEAGASIIDKVEYQIDSGVWMFLPLADPAAGTYSTVWTPAKVDEGSHTISFRAIDRAGNTSKTVSTVVTIDQTPPSLTVSTLSDGSWMKNEVLNISGLVTDNIGVMQLIINSTVVTTNPDGTFSYPVVLQDGTNTVMVKATDLAGNETTDTRMITLDRNAPVIGIITPVDNMKTKQSPIDLTGTVDEQSTVAVKVNGIDPVQALMVGNNFSLPITPAYGLNTIEVIATDRANNTSSVKRTVTFDDRNPSLAVIDPAQDIKTNQANLIIKGEASDLTAVTVTVTIDGNTYTPILTDNRFELPVVFTAEKVYQIYVKAVNEVGSETLVQRNVVYDVTAPVVTIDAVITPSKQKTQLLTGTMEKASSVSVSCPTANVGGVSYPTATTWSAELLNMQEGNNTVTVSAVDEAGNVSDNSVSTMIVVDTIPPDTLITGVPQEPANSTSAGISFLANEEGSTFECQLDSSGYTSCSSPVGYSGLTAGGHTFSVRATDAVGNTDQTPASYTWMIDTDPPTSIILSPTGGATITAATLVITGSASDIGSRIQKVEVSTDGGSTWLAASGTTSWSYSWMVPIDGVYTIKSRATDIAGNIESPVSGATIAVYRRQPVSVTVSGRQLLVNGSPFQIKGVVYSPVPIGADTTSVVPYGDYFTTGYSNIYNRDLPLLRQMGANTVRLNIWDDRADHHDFLDRAYNDGVNPIYVIAGYWINAGMDIDPSSSGSVREQLKADFRTMVANHKNHPAILMWAIGNDLNADSIYGSNPHLFSLINEMSNVAHMEEGSGYHPVTTSLSDGNLINTIAAYDAAVPALDIWSANVYRSNTFGLLFSDYRLVSSKPLAILEYGIDAFDNVNFDEYENIGIPYQSTYAESLWSEISSNANVCIGGAIMEYSDEWWKGKYAIDPSCIDSSSAVHGPCGQAVNFTPDGYDNQEWWGLMRPRVGATGSDVMEPRALYYTLQELWGGHNNAPHITVIPSSINFGVIAVGSNSSVQTLTVSNTGAENLDISSITVTGPNASEFAKQKDYCSNRTLVPGKSCALQMVFVPASAGSKSASVTIQSDDPATPAASVVLTATSTASISGTVTSGGSPISGVTMGLSGAASATTTTDASGNYTFAGLPNGSFTITPAMTEYVFTPANSSVTLSNGNVTGQDFTATPIYSIKGTVTSGGSPLVSATITLTGVTSTTAVTDSFGNYTFEGLTSGNYTVTPEKAGYTFEPSGISLAVNANAIAQNFTGTLITYTITPSAGSGGSISPSTIQTVSYNGSISFAIAPNAGYRISDVAVDGVSKGAITAYTFTNVLANHTISASFTVTDTSIKFGVFGATRVTMTGAGYVDSYDSSKGAYNGTHGINGPIGTNSIAAGAITLSGSAKVYGNAWVGLGGNPTKGIKTSGAATVNGTRGALTVAKDMAPMTDPGGGTSASFTGGTTITSGTYRVSAVNLSGTGVVKVSGNVTLYVTGSMNISGAAKILILPGGALTVYISGSMNVSGGGIVNQTLNPHALTIYGTATCTSANYSGSSALYGAIYAPKATIAISGSSDIYGSVVAASVTLSGSGAIHFDESLGNIGH